MLKFIILPDTYVSASFFTNLYGMPPMVMLKSVVPASTVCGTTMARHSSSTREGMVAVLSTLPEGFTSPVARSILALRTRLGASTIFSVLAHSPSAKPEP